MNPKATRLGRVLRWPQTTRGRVWAGLAAALLAVLAGLAVIAVSVWIESRFPSEEPNRALLPAVQHVVTKPVVQAVSRQLERQVRRRAEARYMVSGLSLDETIARFLDEKTSLSERRLYAYRLARVGSPECIAALLKVLQAASPQDKAFMAQLIGSTGNPAAKAWLVPLLDDADLEVRLATIRGLSVIGGEEVTRRLADLLQNNQAQTRIRLEAALGLGTIGTAEAQQVLTQNLRQSTSHDLAGAILNSLGRFDFPAVADTFEQYLGAAETPSRLRVLAVEALAESSADAAPFLLALASQEENAEVRAAAAWAISNHQTVDELGSVLADLVEQEPSADVRRRLYEALLLQAEIPLEQLWLKVKNEEDLAARVAGYNTLGRGISQSPASAWVPAFDQEIVPELLRIATEPNSENLQMRAVFALRRAQTTAAQTALGMIAQSQHASVATAARNGLRPPKG